MKTALITGSTGYLGSRLTKELILRGIRVLAVARKESIDRIPVGATPIIADALEARSFADALPQGATVVHLVGVPHPAPWKGRAFREVDLVAARAAITAARISGAGHFVYVSVAHPAPVMKDYIAVRRECESLLIGKGCGGTLQGGEDAAAALRFAGESLEEQSQLPFTIVRPYVLGPGHRWPLILKPLYALGEQFAKTGETCRRLGLVTVEEMVLALASAVERGAPVSGKGEIWEVPQIREHGTGKLRQTMRPREACGISGEVKDQPSEAGWYSTL